MSRWVGLWALAFGLLAAIEGGPSGLLLGALLGAVMGRLMHSTLRSEVEREVLRQSQAVPKAAPAPVAESAPALEGTVPVQVEPVTAKPVPVLATTAPVPRTTPGLIDRGLRAARGWLLGGNTVVRVGVAVLFLGLAFLAKWAAEHALFPPELRLAAIGAAGIGLLLAGFRLRSKAAGYSHSLQGAGVAVMYLAVFAAFRMEMLSTLPAFAMLAMVCALSTAIALLQHSRALAFIGFAGAFAAPLLVSSGGGNHVALFSYYLLLGVGVAVIAGLRAWRELNLLGFFATFAAATAWGVLRFQSGDYAVAQGFLIAFFAVYFLATLFYALRHGLAARLAVDGTLVFGLPIVAFGLQAALTEPFAHGQAVSAVALGGFYLLIARALIGRGEVQRWLAECFAVLGLGFVTLAVPLALDAAWTAAVWAVEGAAVFWLGQRQQRNLARLVGLVMQALAGAAFLISIDTASASRWPLANGAFVGSLMLALSAALLAWWSRAPPSIRDAADTPRPWIEPIVQALSPWLFWVALLWWFSGWAREISAATLDFGTGEQVHALLLVIIATATASRWWGEQRAWPIALTPIRLNLPVMLIGLLLAIGLAAGEGRHPLSQFGWVVWPLVWAAHLHSLSRQDHGAPLALWRWVHAGHVWWVVGFIAALLVHAIERADLWASAWATVILQVAGTAVLLQLCTRPFWREPATRWPLDRHAASYTWLGAAPLAVLILLGSVSIAIGSRGNAAPLPYVPLLNPTDLCILLSLAALALWILRLRASRILTPAPMHDMRPWLVLAAALFLAINTMWLRVAHHWGGVAWSAESLFDSFLVQTGYSILWTLLALAAMWVAHRRTARATWMAGALLLGLTVLKLLLVDQQNAGGGERIIAFIAVGALMLVIGYLAPLPPKAQGAVA